MRVLMLTSEWPTPERPVQAAQIVRQVEHLRAAGVEVDVFAFRGGGNLFKYLKAWQQVRRRHRLAAFDLLHAQFGQSGVLAWGPPRKPLVVTFRGSDVQGIVGAKGQYRLSSFILRHVSRFVARGAQERIVVADHLATLLPSGLSAHVIPSGIDLDLFRPIAKDEARRALKLHPDKRLILFTAPPRYPVKRYYLARQAVDLIEAFDAELVIMADIPHAVVPLYMNACDVLLLTSKHEGSPNVVKEALACNLPVVSVDVGDVRQRIEGVEGCIVCPDDAPETIAEAVARVLRQKPCIKGREAVLELDERLMAQKVIDIYRAVLGKQP